MRTALGFIRKTRCVVGKEEQVLADTCPPEKAEMVSLEQSVAETLGQKRDGSGDQLYEQHS